MQRASALPFAVVFVLLCSLFVVDLALGEDNRSATKTEYGDDTEDRDRTQVCVVVVNIAENDQYASTNGMSDPSTAEIAQELGISVNVVQDCLQQAGAGEPPIETTAPETPDPETPKDGSDVMANTIPKKPLPSTGGLPLLGVATLGFIGAIAGASVLRAGLRREE